MSKFALIYLIFVLSLTKGLFPQENLNRKDYKNQDFEKNYQIFFNQVKNKNQKGQFVFYNHRALSEHFYYKSLDKAQKQKLQGTYVLYKGYLRDIKIGHIKGVSAKTQDGTNLSFPPLLYENIKNVEENITYSICMLPKYNHCIIFGDFWDSSNKHIPIVTHGINKAHKK